MIEVDPIWHMMPQDQVDRVFGYHECDITPEFLGFTEVYLHLSCIIPTHWTVVDLGCAYAPQAFLFKDHALYVGVDAGGCERFSAPNTKHYTMTIADFLTKHGGQFDKCRTFAICSYVPPWYGHNSGELARKHFDNVFTYYPARDPTEKLPFYRAPRT